MKLDLYAERRGLIAAVGIFVFATIVIGVSLVALPSDPWKDKDYKAWTAEEVQKILWESPWVKMVEISAPWLKSPTPHVMMPMATDCNGRPDITRGERTPSSWATGNTDSIVVYQVTWQSASTVRSAKFRQASLCGKADIERGDDILDQEQDNYVIVVNSPDMTPFENIDDNAWSKNSYLLFKKTGKKITPDAVVPLRYGTKAIYSLTFKFPKRAENGEPLLTPDEKEIEFASQAGKFSLKTRFQIAKMMVKDKPDL